LFAITEPLFWFDSNLNFKNQFLLKFTKHEIPEIDFFRIALVYTSVSQPFLIHGTLFVLKYFAAPLDG
jgi:hypothetical protein